MSYCQFTYSFSFLLSTFPSQAPSSSLRVFFCSYSILLFLPSHFSNSDFLIFIRTPLLLSPWHWSSPTSWDPLRALGGFALSSWSSSFTWMWVTVVIIRAEYASHYAVSWKFPSHLKAKWERIQCGSSQGLRQTFPTVVLRMLKSWLHLWYARKNLTVETFETWRPTGIVSDYATINMIILPQPWMSPHP